jgi:Zn-dependent protease/predicted transcriptional regulator
MKPQPGTERTRGVLFGGFRLGRILGINLSVDWSLFIIFWLVALSLAMGLLPQWHPGWSGALSWTVALAAAVLFFASILLHEMSHALVARAFGVPVSEITLFLFGGLAQMKREVSSPKAELLIAGVGPLTSIVIGALALLWGGWLSAETSVSVDSPVALIQGVGPLATLLLWLGPVNLILGLFNLVPGFPLDGGRVLRAIVWWATGSLLTATRWAAGAGRAFAWLLMGIGAAMALGLQVPLFGGGFISGMWLVLIGWFLNNAAHTSYRQVEDTNTLRNVPVSSMMNTHVLTVPLDLSVEDFVNQRLLRSSQRAFPVLSADRIVGLVCFEDVRRVSSDSWRDTSVNRIMTPLNELSVTAPENGAAEALNVLVERDINQMPVVDDGHLLGLLRRQDIMRWLAVHRELHAN